jgi:hypothetical protein
VKIVIKNPAPIGKNQTKWGDFHFGGSLASALRMEGAEVIQHFWPEWDREEDEDLVIVMRGKHCYVPRRKVLSLLWVISHPATVRRDEMEMYDGVFLASKTHYDMIRDSVSTDVDVARQCTDARLFSNPAPIETRRGVNFVANSRGIRRDMVVWAVSTNTAFSIIGRHWGSVGLRQYVSREYIENDELAEHYRSTRLSLNDHWGDMAHFGYINNRLFDCLACGLPLITDTFPELGAVFGNALLYAKDAESFQASMDAYRLRYPEVFARAAEWWQEEGANYTFESRAQQILDWARKGNHGRRYSARAAAHSPAEDSDLRKTVELAIERRRRDGVSGEIQLIHLGPTEAGVATLTSIDEIGYLSAGFGRGPWHVPLSGDLSALPDRRYDLIVLDDVAKDESSARSEMLAGLRDKLSPGGGVVMSERMGGLGQHSAEGRVWRNGSWLLSFVD